MKELAHYLDEAKKVTGSDYATAARIGMTRQAVSTARKRGAISNLNAAKLAEILNINPTEIIAACEVKAHPENASHWQKWVAACLIMGMLGMSENAVNTGLAAELNNATSYRLCEVSNGICNAYDSPYLDAQQSVACIMEITPDLVTNNAFIESC